MTINWKLLYSFQREIKKLGGILLKEYFKNLVEVASRGDAREESFYEVLKNLLNEYTSSILGKKFHVTTLPKQTEAGNPDFRIWDGKQHIVGYIEAKAPGVEDLDRVAHSEQLKRYFDTFPNLILTNFFEFRLYREGTLIEKVLTGRPYVMTDLGKIPPVENENEFLSLLEKFFSFSLPKVYNAKKLAVELAKRTRFLRDEVIAEELREEESKGEGNILGFFEAFKDYLIKGLTKEDFADLYSQTIAYGLFAARTRTDKEFNRKLAYDNIPHTIGILRDVFEFISLGEIPESMEWIVDDISEVLAVTDVKSILHKYFHEGKGKDPIIHFYETFLSEYDPETREQRGVYYTPEPVVSFIVHSLNQILKEHFNKPGGFASEGVTVLDPAAGTLTFIAEAAKLAVEEFTSKYGEGGKEGFIRDHILENFYAFELMMAPYAVGHLKMSFLLEELGYKLKEDDRFKLYLTNTLEMEELPETKLPGMISLSKESHLAGKVKREQPILVILGNPPYSIKSTNKSEFIEEQMDLYKEDVRDEKNIQPLSDDYIKFIRFAHWKIEQTGKGVIGMITNNSYLSGLIHRGMRKKLLNSFDDIYILNLHGNSHIGETTPEGKKDENVFDIMQGDSIALFVKNEKNKKIAEIHYRDLYGLREEKYDFLNKNDYSTCEWRNLKSEKEYSFFVPKDFSLFSQYEKFLSIPTVFKKYSSGVTTHRDNFVVGFSEEEVKQKMRIFTSELSDETVKQSLSLKETSDFNIELARKKIKNTNWEQSITSYSYRPFDNRYICYYSELIDRDRFNIMQHFFRNNLGLVVMRQYLYDYVDIYDYVLSVDRIVDRRLFISNRGAGFVFPLFLFAENGEKSLFGSSSDDKEKEPNIKLELLKIFTKLYKKEITPEEIYYYIYGILYSKIYRKKYSEFLKIDFPKIPFTKDYKLFKEIGRFGKELVDLHLLKSGELESPISHFQGVGDKRIDKTKETGRNYSPKEKRIYINKDKQYFEGIEPEVWKYHIGGYQVLDTWLKYRKDRKLSTTDIKHFCKMATAISKTIEIQKEIDVIYPEVEKDVVEF